ncbi:MAG: transcription antitermination factor NusB [Prevotellaceae bacterium]|jgi:N utilization substance protein B|nr:transcription antitermination factor NusB [Prevotellaceae bacterium]
MINRILVRIKSVQLLYAYLKNPSKSADTAEKELFHSLQQTYNLYHLLLLLVTDITFYAEKRLDAAKHKLFPTPEDLNPNTRFIHNAFASELARNEQFNVYIKENKLSWNAESTTIKKLYENIVESPEYVEYMTAPSTSFAIDREFWRKIFKRYIITSEELEAALEEQSIYWNDDFEIVVSFVLKTIKNFEENSVSTKAILPMFRDADDREFASKLFRISILKGQEYRELIESNIRNWDLDRVAFMDIVIMQLALTEIMNFPSIPVSVTLNEYIEIAKNYSTDRSSTFINGVLDNIVNQLKSENKFVKAKILPANSK